MIEYVKRENAILKKECVGMELDKFISKYLSRWWVLTNQSVNPNSSVYLFTYMGGLHTLEVTTEWDSEKRKNIIEKIIFHHCLNLHN